MRILSLAAAAVLNVAPGGSDSGACSSASPCASIATALGKAAAGDTVEVAAGTYSGPGNRDITMPAGVTLRGQGPSATIIDLEAKGRGFHLDSTSDGSVIEQLAVINGDCAALDVDDAPDDTQKAVWQNGAGFWCYMAEATIRDVRVEQMECTSGIDYTKWSGAAFFLHTCKMQIERAEVIDVRANHGGGVATWGDDLSVFKDSTFLRGEGTGWGGTMLLEANSYTEFHNCAFRECICLWGGCLDDGGTASPLFKNCVFENSVGGNQGMAVLTFGTSQSRFHDTTFRNLTGVTGIVYINAGTKPEFIRCTWEDCSTTFGEAAAIRSYHAGLYNDAPSIIKVEDCNFRNLEAPANYGGAVTTAGHMRISGCTFDGAKSRDRGAAIAYTPEANAGSLEIVDTVFENCVGSDGVLHIGGDHPEGTATHPGPVTVTITNSAFRNNKAVKMGKGAGITVGATRVNLEVTNVQFEGNAGFEGGGAIDLVAKGGPASHMVFNDVTFKGNSVVGNGAALRCQSQGGEATVVFHNAAIEDSESLGDGAGFWWACHNLTMRNSRFTRNNAVEGYGGAMVISGADKAACGSSFKNVELVDNTAKLGGGALFYDHLEPGCRIEKGPIEAEFESAWSWDDRDAMLRGNTAQFGDTECTAPSRLVVSDGAAITAASVVPGSALGYEITLVDWFEQQWIGDFLVIEASSDLDLAGLDREVILAGRCEFSTLAVKAPPGTNGALAFQISRTLTQYASVDPVEIALEISACPGGSILVGGVACEQCRPGEFASGGDACEKCAIGTFAADFGQEKCGACPPGTVSERASAQCDVCPQGTVPDAARQRCLPCAIGTYAIGGQASCSSCPTSFSTLSTGAYSAESCTCGEGTYWNVRDDRCEPCPRESFCPGWWHLPVVYTKSYGRYVGDISSYDAAREAKIAGTFKASDFSDGLSALKVYGCKSAAVCPGRAEMSFSFPQGLPDRTKAGVSAGETCPMDRVAVACQRCPEGFYGQEDCHECAGAATAGTVIIILLLPLLFYGIYKMTTSHGAQRVQSAFLLVSTIGVIAFFLQTIAVFGSFTVGWPEELTWLFDLASVFVFDFSGFSVTCAYGTEFGPTYWASIVMPLILVAILVVTFAASQVLAEQHRMVKDKTISLCGMLISSLYITLVKVVTSYFECSDNPAAPDTLAKYRDIECDSSEHTSLLGASILGLLLYVIGIYLTFGYATYVAPASFDDIGFRERWKFLLNRWRPATWYWGMVMLSRNLLVAMARLVSTMAETQLVFLAIVTLVFSSLQAVWWPWRLTPLNYFDLTSCIMLCIIGLFGLVFISLSEQATLNARLELFDLADELLATRDNYAVALLFMVIALMCGFSGVLLWCIVMFLPGNMQQQHTVYMQKCKVLSDKLQGAHKDPAFLEMCNRVILDATDYDRRGLSDFLDTLEKSKAIGQAQGGIGTTRQFENPQVQGNTPASVQA